MAELPATFGATGGAIAPMPERRETPPTARHALEGAPPPAETTPSRAEPNHVTALAAEPVQVKEAGFAALKKLSALGPLAMGIAALLVLIGADGGLSMRTDPAIVASNAPAEAAANVHRRAAFHQPFHRSCPETISPTALPRISPPNCRASTTVSSSPATPPSPLRARTSTPGRSARSLAIRYVLEGSVQRDANRVRVNAQLIDAESGAHLWADRFEEDVVDLFKLQDEVVVRLARTLQLELVNAEAQRSLHDRPRNPDAVDLTMRGWAVFNQSFTECQSTRGLSLI